MTFSISLILNDQNSSLPPVISYTVPKLIERKSPCIPNPGTNLWIKPAYSRAFDLDMSQDHHYYHGPILRNYVPYGESGFYCVPYYETPVLPMVSSLPPAWMHSIAGISSPFIQNAPLGSPLEENKLYLHAGPASQMSARVTVQKSRRLRRRYCQIQRKYECSYPSCTKSYGSLNHLNTHIATKKHGSRKCKADFKEAESVSVIHPTSPNTKEASWKELLGGQNRVRNMSLDLHSYCHILSSDSPERLPQMLASHVPPGISNTHTNCSGFHQTWWSSWKDQEPILPPISTYSNKPRRLPLIPSIVSDCL